MRRKALRSFLARFRWGGFPLRFDESREFARGFVPAATGFEPRDFLFKRGKRLLCRFEGFGLFFHQRNKLVFGSRGQHIHNLLYGRTTRKYSPI